MNVEDYIASGILESYVLGELSSEEQKSVASMAKQYPEISKELEKIEHGIELLAQKSKIQPNPLLKEKVWEKLKGSDNAPSLSLRNEKKQHENSYTITRYVAAASVMIALLTSYLAFNYYKKWKETANQLSTLTERQALVAADYQKVTLQLEAIEKDLIIINNVDFARIDLQGTDNAPEALSTVYWNEKTSELFLNIQHLNEISTSFQYQLWAIVDGKPIDAGLVPKENNGLIPMKNIQGAQAFAITIEAKGGSEIPSLATMQVYGEVG